MIAFERGGAGEPVLLLHGGLSTHEEWRAQIDDLSTDHDVIAWDCPGCGDSGDPDPEWDLSGFGRAAWGLLDELGIASAHVVGLSFGGGLALELYRQRPSAVRSLVLLSAYAGWRGSLPADEVARRLASGGGADARTFLGSRAPDALVDEVRRLERSCRPTFVAAARAFADADLTDVLPTVTVPTLVLAGSEDARAPLHVAEQLHQGIAGSRLVVLEGVGHCLNLEAAEAVSRAIREHIAFP